MFRTAKSLIVAALTGLTILVVIGLAGSGLVLYRQAAAIHPVLGWLVLAGIATGVVLLVVVPLVRVLRLPGTLKRPASEDGRAWEKFVRAYGRRLVQNARLRDGYEGLAELEAAREASLPELQEQVEKALAYLDERAKEAVARHAAAVFTATAVSQSGRLDAAIVISAQFRMVKEVATIYYQRPHPRELWRLYANVGAAAFLAGEIQDSELLAVLGAPVSAGITGFLPVAGADPLVNLLVQSLLDGSANAFLTLRVGTLARRYCGLHLEESRSLVARSASLEAAVLLGAVVGQGAARVANLTQKALVGGAVKGTTKAARGVAGLGTNLFGKIAGLAGKAGSKAAETAGVGARFLRESLAFWEKVAETSESPQEEPPAGT